MEFESDRSETVDRRDPTELLAPPPGADNAVAPSPVAFVTDTAVGTETVLTSRTSRFTPSALVAGIAAIALLLVGGITAARAGIDSTLDEPVVEVANYTATALLGLIELAFGLMLLMAALTRSRRSILFLGIVGGVLALVAVFQPSAGRGWLAIERGFAVWVAIGMGVVAATALLPTVRRSNVIQRTSDVT